MPLFGNSRFKYISLSYYHANYFHIFYLKKETVIGYGSFMIIGDWSKFVFHVLINGNLGIYSNSVW